MNNRMGPEHAVRMYLVLNKDDLVESSLLPCTHYHKTIKAGVWCWVAQWFVNPLLSSGWMDTEIETNEVRMFGAIRGITTRQN